LSDLKEKQLLVLKFIYLSQTCKLPH